MNRKLYPCEKCGREVAIRSRLGDGRKVCGPCKQSESGSSGIHSRGRKKQSTALNDLFEIGMKEVQSNPVCQNCGCRINATIMPKANVAHILRKSIYKSVAAHPENYVILCAFKDNGPDCHTRFDNNIYDRPGMPVFRIAMQKFVNFQSEVLEYGKERSIFEENI